MTVAHSIMQLPVIKAVLATAWILSAVGIMAGSNHLSLIDHLTLGFLAVVPPVAMWFAWHEPTPTMSESIHGVRNERAGAVDTKAVRRETSAGESPSTLQKRSP